MLYVRRHVWSVTLSVTIALVGFMFVSAPSVSATDEICRTDPIFYFTNGQSVTVQDAVATNSANVKSLDYQLHVPVGLVLDHVVSTGIPAGATETYSIVADQQANRYLASVTVQVAGAPTRVGGMIQVGEDAGYGAGMTGSPFTLGVGR